MKTEGGVLIGVIALFTVGLFIMAMVGLPTKPGTPAYPVSQELIPVSQEIIIEAKKIRREAAEEFVGDVVKCISPQILPNQNLTAQHVEEYITTTITTCFPPKEKNDPPKWTYEFPCKVKLNESRYILRGEVKFGDIEICKTTIGTGLIIAFVSCRRSTDFIACLTSSVMETDDVKKEIDKPVKL